MLKTFDLSVIQERIPPGTAEVRHFHHRAQQFFYILAGEAVMEVNDQPMTLTTGEGRLDAPSWYAAQDEE